MGENNTCIFAIDIGTSSVKVSVLNESGVVEASAARPYETRHPKPGYAQQTPDDWWKAAIACSKEIREKSLALTRYLMELIDAELARYGFTVGNPREDARRGGHVCLEHDDAVRINEALKAADVVPDFRYPNVIRLAPVAQYTRFEDVYELVRRLVEIMETKAYLNYSDKIGPVA